MKSLSAIASAFLLVAPASAVGFQNLDALEARLVAALGANVGEPGGPVAPLDRRMKLGQCPQTVTIEPPLLGAVALRCAPLGWRVRVPLARLGGTNLAAAAAPTKAEMVVRRGDPVDLVAEQPGFSVSVSGIAQEDGATGGRIRVRTDGAAPGQTLFAEVIGAGLVKLPGFK